jgi:hypothetical protein
MPVSYKIVLPETGDSYRFDPHQYGKAVEKWHEEITWLDCDTYLLRVSDSEAGEEEQIVMWYLRDYPAFSCPPNCSWCSKFQIARSRYLGINPATAEAEARRRYIDWKEGRLVYREAAAEEDLDHAA